MCAASVCRAGELRADQDDADLHAIARVGQRVAWVVGDRGVAWTTRDGGRTWSLVPLPGRIACRSVCFLSNRVGWIGGNDERPGHSRGVLLSTRDGGATWESSWTNAVQRARAENKPILHFQLLGRLNEKWC
mgnify:CR=1 FL=1